jgi:hypothetical protein
MSVEVGLLSELLGAFVVWAGDVLSILDGLAGMVHFDMFLQLPS